MYMMNEAASIAKNTIIFGGSAGSEYMVGPIFVPGSTFCHKCVYGLSDQDQESIKQYPFLQNIRNQYVTTLINPFNSIAASFISIEVIKYLSGYLPYLKNSALIGNVATHEIDTRTAVQKREGCKIC